MSKKVSRFKIISKELTIFYDIDDTGIEIYGNTDDETPFEFRILDIEQDKHTGGTSIQCSNLDDIVSIINDFKEQFNKLK